MMRRFWRIFRLLALLSIVIAAIAVILVSEGDPTLHINMLVATALGVGLTVLLGTALMTLVVPQLGQRPRRRRGGADSSQGEGMTDLERAPILRVMPGPADINANGHIFGGWVLSQMDIAAGIVASRRARGPVATVAIEAMKFIAPIHLRDLISVYAEVERVGRTSMGVRIEVIAHRDLGATEVKVTEGLFTFVALDANNRPRPVDQA